MQLPFSLYDFFGYLAAGFVLVVGSSSALSHREIWRDDLTTLELTVLIVLSYLVGHAVSGISKPLIEGLTRRILGPPSERLFGQGPPKWPLLGLSGWYLQPLPDETRRAILAGAERRGISSPAQDFYGCFLIARRDEIARERMNTFLNLYGFARSMTLALSVVGCALVVGETRDTASTGPFLGPGVWSLFAFGLAVVMYYRFLKFYRLYAVEVYGVLAHTS